MPAPKLPRDPKLERALIVSAANQAYIGDGKLYRLMEMANAEDFDVAAHRPVWATLDALTHERQALFYVTLVLERLGWTTEDWGRFCADVESITWEADLFRAAERVHDLACRRKLILVGQSLTKLGADPDQDVDDIVSRALRHLGDVTAAVPEVAPARSLAEIMGDDPEHEYAWAVPGLFEFGDSLIITGAEGRGKMTLLRQLAVQLAVGFHPWTGDPFEPLRSLVIDLQDGRRRNERQLRLIARRAGVDPTSHLWAESWQQGLDIIGRRADRRRLEGLVRKHAPDVLVLGPLYKLAMHQPRADAETAEGILDFLEHLRSRYGVMLFLEGHSAKAGAGGFRSYEPYGAQTFMAWPDAGYGLAPKPRDPHGVILRDWRGNRDREAKVWPEALVHGEVWPWVPPNVHYGALRARGQSGRVMEQVLAPGSNGRTSDETFLDRGQDPFDTMGGS